METTHHTPATHAKRRVITERAKPTTYKGNDTAMHCATNVQPTSYGQPKGILTRRATSRRKHNLSGHTLPGHKNNCGRFSRGARS